MRSAETVFSIIRERGKRGLPLERVQHLLYDEELYLRAYAKLYPNKGAMTKGSTDETVDAMSRRKIKGLIDDLRQRRFRWTPVRRIYIPKKKGVNAIIIADHPLPGKVSHFPKKSAMLERKIEQSGGKERCIQCHFEMKFAPGC